MTPVLRRVRRRERFRSRSLASSIAVAVVALGAAYLGTECVLAAVGRPALLAAPAALLAVPGGPASTWNVPVAVVLAVLGLIAIGVAVAPGRRARHVLDHERMAIVVDDDVLAGATSRRAAATASVGRDQVTTVIGGRRSVVELRPTSGFPLDRETVAEATAALLVELAVRPPMRTRVRLSDRAVVAR